MLEEALVHLGLTKPTEVHLADDHQYPTNYVVSMDSTQSPSSPVLAPVKVETTLIKNSLQIVEYGNFIRRFQVHEDDDDDDDDMTCVVCLNYIEKSDEIRELSNCSHVFHRECPDTWVNNDRVTCPLCRSTLYQIQWII
ncbi:E3 ubiquitin-protein ligase EL5-like [Durio zibethinus]|uniref:E3 ubiquitin-protein ligase EL5-like n=1 Tax=Durio zibethinus TaxID=66656 RepID=A0A6P5YAC9_DURZI|nr:E3 ubiquitin-protein ligase EL5-like [Durio zibethinus]